MKGTESKQKAELRVVLHNNGRYHLLLDARVTGFDVYAGDGNFIKKMPMFKSSWHESGKVHTHTPIGRQIGPQKVKPKNFKGKAQTFLGL